MMNLAKQITEFVHKNDRITGIHGILIKFFALRNGKKCFLGAITTMRDGSFFWNSSKKDHTHSKTKKYLAEVFDRDNNLISTIKEVNFVNKEKSEMKPYLQVILTDDKLANHLSKPLDWLPPEGALVSEAKLGLIRRAFSDNISSNRNDKTEFEEIIKKVTPSINDFSGVLMDAWRTIAGDFESTSRFVRTLDIVGEDMVNQTVDFDESKTGEVSSLNREYIKEFLAKFKGFKSGYSDNDSIISNENTILLILAAVHAGKGQTRQIINRYLSIVLRQLKAYETLNELHSAALLALTDKEQGTAFFKGTLKLVSEHLENLDRSKNLRLINLPAFYGQPNLDQHDSQIDNYLNHLYTPIFRVAKRLRFWRHHDTA